VIPRDWVKTDIKQYDSAYEIAYEAFCEGCGRARDAIVNADMSDVLSVSALDDMPLIDLGLGSPENRAGQRVVIAMSGGVDSSVAAALVKRAGYDAVGITLQLYDHGEAIRRKGACCAGQDIHDARAVAASSTCRIMCWIMNRASKKA
jgi:asparagine synthetase B (glutamine-hydrolysing)